MSANGAVKERFFVRQAMCVRCKNVSEVKGDFWDKYKKTISEMALQSAGYHLEMAVHFEEDGEDFRAWFSEAKSVMVAERDFRGYVMDSDTTLIVDQSFVDDMKARGCRDFEVGSRHMFSEIIHNDAENSVDYVLYDFITDGKDKLLEVDVKKTLSEYLDDLQDDSFEEAALDELGIYDDEDEEDIEYDEAPEEIEKSISHTGYEALPVEAVERV